MMIDRADRGPVMELTVRCRSHEEPDRRRRDSVEPDRWIARTGGDMVKKSWAVRLLNPAATRSQGAGPADCSDRRRRDQDELHRQIVQTGNDVIM